MRRPRCTNWVASIGLAPPAFSKCCSIRKHSDPYYTTMESTPLRIMSVFYVVTHMLSSMQKTAMLWVRVRSPNAAQACATPSGALRRCTISAQSNFQPHPARTSRGTAARLGPVAQRPESVAACPRACPPGGHRRGVRQGCSQVLQRAQRRAADDVLRRGRHRLARQAAVQLGHGAREQARRAQPQAAQRLHQRGRQAGVVVGVAAVVRAARDLLE